MLIATVQWHQWDFYIDMSRAFDTIKQGKALEVLNMAGCNDDDHHLVWVLLVNTHLTIGVKGTHPVSMVWNFSWIPSRGFPVSMVWNFSWIPSRGFPVSMVWNFSWIPSRGFTVPCTLHLLPSCCIMCSMGEYIMAESPSFRPTYAPLEWEYADDIDFRNH